MDFFKILKGGVGVGMSNFDRLFAEKHGGEDWQLTTLTDTIPLTFQSKGTPLTDYKLYGTSEGAGVETENLLNPDENKQGEGYISNKILTSTGMMAANSFWTSEFIPIKPNTKYWVFRNLFRATGNNSVIKFYASATEYLSYGLIPGHLTDVKYSADNCSSFTTPSSANYLKISVDKNSSMNCIVESEECPVSFIPYGYKLPMTVESEAQSQDIPIYIGDSKLMAEEYVDYESGKVYRDIDGVLTPTDPPVALPELSTYQGENTLSCSEGLGEVSITGYIKGE